MGQEGHPRQREQHMLGFRGGAHPQAKKGDWECVSSRIQVRQGRACQAELLGLAPGCGAPAVPSDPE